MEKARVVTLALLVLSTLLIVNTLSPIETASTAPSDTAGVKRPPKPTPTPPAQLVLRACNQLVVSDGYGQTNKRVHLFDSVSETVYSNSWNSSDKTSLSADIGDADNDGEKEIVSVWGELARRKGKYVLQDLRLNLWENGASSSPTVTSPNLASVIKSRALPTCIKIGDADNDGENEIVLAAYNFIAVFAYDSASSNFDLLWSEDVGECVWSVSIGDANNDGLNEIVGAIFKNGYAIVWSYNGNNTWIKIGMTDSIGQDNIDRAKIGDVDDDGENEIVGGGTNNSVVIWRFNGVKYPVVWMSDDLGGYTQGVGVGDIDNDGKNEIVAGTAAPVVSDSAIYVIEHDGTAYSVVWTYKLSYSVCALEVGDADNDGKSEFAALGTTISIFTYDNNEYSLAWTKDLGNEMNSVSIG